MGRRQFTSLARTEEAAQTVKIAEADTNSDVNAIVIEVAAGRGYLKSVQQLITPYLFGEQHGYITVTIDGVPLAEMELVRMVYDGSYPGTLSCSMNIFYSPSVRYEDSLKVEHRRTKSNGGAVEVRTVVTYTEE